jgi:uncharacterized protein
MEKQLLIIFVNNLIGGKVKAGFAQSMGEKKALEVYKLLLKHTRNIAIPLPCEKIVYYSDFIPVIDEWQLVGFKQGLQKGVDLAERMRNAFADAFVGGYKEVVVIGNDCFQLTSKLIDKGFDELKNHDVVLGPSNNDGYYLLGMKRVHGKLFKKKGEGLDPCFKNIVQDLDELQLSYSFLPVLDDVIEERDITISTGRKITG